MQAKRGPEPRFFNQISYDEQAQTVTKRSRYETKLIDEIHWYLLIPEALEKYVPTIRDYTLQRGNVRLVMERVGGLVLSEMYLSNLLDEREWSSCFQSVLRLMETFAEYTVDPDMESLKSIYIDKTARRIQQILTQHEQIRSFAARGSLVLNGKNVRCPIGLFSQYKAEFCNLANSRTTHIIHGDLCFSNLFYSPQTRELKLIDPRGRFGRYKIHGDPRYDLAKLRHSLSGYDHIVTDAFALKVDGKRINLSLLQSPFQKKLRALWDELIYMEMPQVRLIESLLFLSMIPLHVDRPKRQLAMYAVSALLMEEAIK